MSFDSSWAGQGGSRLPELSERDRKTMARLLNTSPRDDGSTHEGVVDNQLVLGTCHLVDYSGVVELVAQAREDEARRQPRGPGGRPSIYKDRDRLGQSPQSTEMRNLVLHRLSDDSLRLLGLPVGKKRGSRRAVYERIRYARRRLMSILDPKPGSTKERLSRAFVETIRQDRDPAEVARKQNLLDEVNNRLLEASWQLLEPEVRQRWTGNIAFDATTILVFGGRGNPTDPKKCKPTDSMSPEIEAGWGVLKKDKKETLVWSWSLHLAVTIPDPYSKDQFPILALGMRMDTPGKRSAEAAVSVARSIAERGHPVGYFISDRGYFSQCLYDDFNKPMKEIGYKLVGQYRDDQMGRQGQQRGAVQASGAFHCPSIPQELYDIDKTVGRSADWHAFQQRRKQLAMAEFRPKGDGLYMCPAMGPGATAKCTARPDGPLWNTAVDKPHLVIDPGVPASELPECCTKKSIALNPEKNTKAKLLQDVSYRSQRWEDLWDTRGRVEGFNGYAKDQKKQDLESQHHRRTRGFADNAIVLAVLTLATNLRKIEAFNSGEAPAWKPPRPVPPRFGYTRKPEWAKARQPSELPTHSTSPPAAA